MVTSGKKKEYYLRFHKRHPDRRKKYYLKFKKLHPGRISVLNHEWYERNKLERKAAQARYRKKVRLKVLEHYGGKCQCCGEDKYEFLSIDHINGGGNKHRKENGLLTGQGTYRWLIRNNFPKGFRVLCHNCNFAFGHYKKCPHQ